MADKINLKPLGDRALVKRLEADLKSPGGIVIPGTAKEKPQEGLVCALGTGKVREDGSVQPLSIKLGDKIIFSKYSGSEIKINGEEYVVLREDDIIGIFTE